VCSHYCRSHLFLVLWKRHTNVSAKTVNIILLLLIGRWQPIFFAFSLSFNHSLTNVVRISRMGVGMGGNESAESRSPPFYSLCLSGGTELIRRSSWTPWHYQAYQDDVCSSQPMVKTALDRRRCDAKTATSAGELDRGSCQSWKKRVFDKSFFRFLVFRVLMYEDRTQNCAPAWLTNVTDRRTNRCPLAIIIIKAICRSPQEGRKCAVRQWENVAVSYKQQCLQLCPKGRETKVRHSQRSGQAVPHTIAPCKAM